MPRDKQPELSLNDQPTRKKGYWFGKMVELRKRLRLEVLLENAKGGQK